MTTYTAYGLGKPTFYMLTKLTSLSCVPATVTFYIAWGTGGTGLVADLSAYKLGMEDEVARFAATDSRDTVTATNDTMVVSYDWTITLTDNGKILNELALWDAAIGGNMWWYGYAYKVGTGIWQPTLVTGDIIQFRIRFTGKWGVFA